MDLVVVGSIPTRHPFLFNAIVAHLDRATDFESVGSTFESCQSQADVVSKILTLFFDSDILFDIDIICLRAISSAGRATDS